jgi:hypothetical protein
MTYRRVLPWGMIFIAPVTLSGCTVPYFDNFSESSPSGHYVNSIPIAAILQQVKCEVRTLIAEQQKIADARRNRIEWGPEYLTLSKKLHATPKENKAEREKIKTTMDNLIHEDYLSHSFELAIDNIADIKLDLKTDETGNLAATAIDLKKMGLDGLAQVIAAKNPPKDLTPVLGASVQAHSAKTVSITLNLVQAPLPCPQSKAADGMGHFYLKEWMTNFLQSLNDQKIDPYVDEKLWRQPSVVLNQISLSTQFEIVVDISAGLNVFNFASSLYLIPVQAPPSLGFKANYGHTLQVVLRGNGLKARDHDAHSPIMQTEGGKEEHKENGDKRRLYHNRWSGPLGGTTLSGRKNPSINFDKYLMTK